MSPIDYEQLLELYNNLLIENKKLKEELASYKNKKVPLKEKSEFNMFASPQKKIVLFKRLESSVIVNEIQEALFNKAASQCD